MSPTPDERRATWIEPGLSRLLDERGRVADIAIDLGRANSYGGNGISLVGPGRSILLLSASAIRRLYRQLPPE